MEKKLEIEVAFLTPLLQKLINLKINENTTIDEAITQSQINQYFPEYNLLELPVGVYGKQIMDKTNYKFKNHDRLEIYRPLNLTPNQKRLSRAKK